MKPWMLLIAVPLGAWLIYSYNCRNNYGDDCLFSLKPWPFSIL